MYQELLIGQGDSGLVGQSHYPTIPPSRHLSSHRPQPPLSPFSFRRPVLLARNVFANRERPDLAALSRIEDPERFVWAILPHAARTFSACIAMLPSRAALPAAVAYLDCRMLDTYEALVPDRVRREAQLVAFGARFGRVGAGARLPPAPRI